MKKIEGNLVPFGVVDADNMVYEKGMFSRFLGEVIPVGFNHNLVGGAPPVGMLMLKDETDAGLVIEGYALDSAKWVHEVYEAISLLRPDQKSTWGGSIAFKLADVKVRSDGVLVPVIDRVFEASLTPWPAVPGGHLDLVNEVQQKSERAPAKGSIVWTQPVKLVVVDAQEALVDEIQQKSEHAPRQGGVVKTASPELVLVGVEELLKQ